MYTKEQYSTKHKIRDKVWDEHIDATCETQKVKGLMRVLCTYQVPHPTLRKRFILREFTWGVAKNGDVVHEGEMVESLVLTPREKAKDINISRLRESYQVTLEMSDCLEKDGYNNASEIYAPVENGYSEIERQVDYAIDSSLRILARYQEEAVIYATGKDTDGEPLTTLETRQAKKVLSKLNKSIKKLETLKGDE